LFNTIYKDVRKNALDRCAELIRSLDEYTPGSFQRFLELSKIPEQTKIPRAELMVQELLQDSETMIQTIMEAFAIAQESGQEGAANFLAERQEAHAKWAWQLRSILKKQRA
jgi:DNA-binding ferritin-like protein